MTRIYLDNAATSWPKPESVYRKVDEYQRNVGASTGRSGYAEAAQVARDVEKTRREVARLLGARNHGQLIFTFNGTDALNTALHGALRPGDHVITSVIEHNSVLRPLACLEQSGVSMTRVGCDSQGFIDPCSVRNALRPTTQLIVISHASNVTGALQPIDQIGEIAHAADALFLVDSAQTAGHVPIALEDSPIDMLAASGHKGLLGPLGTGVLYFRSGVEEHVHHMRQGGTGVSNDDDHHPLLMPSKFEAGNMNVPGLLGLGAAAEFLFEHSVAKIRRRHEELTGRLIEGLSRIAGLRILGPRHPERQVGLVSVTLEGFDPQEVAAMLDASHRVQTRPGLHCAPRMHQALGTFAHGGATRFSLGAFTTADHIDAAVAAMTDVALAAVH